MLRAFSPVGGTEQYALSLARHLVGEGHEVEVLCGEVDPRLEGEPGLVVRRLLPHLPRGARGVLALARAAEAIDLRAYDVVQGFGRTTRHHVFRAGGGAHARWLALRPVGQVERLWQALDPRQRLELRLDRRAVLGARVVICNSEMARDDLVRWYGLEPLRARVVRNGVDGSRFRPDPAAREAAREAWGVPEGGRVALFLGSGFRRKGLDAAARAFASVAERDDRLVVTGRDSRAAARLRAAQRLVGGRLVALGPTSAAERIYPGADATLLPTHYDPAANTTLEALSCGVPPVTTARDGNAEISPDPRLVVQDPRDVRGLADALRYAWEADLGERCRAVAGAWPVSRNGAAMTSIYRELTHG